MSASNPFVRSSCLVLAAAFFSGCGGGQQEASAPIRLSEADKAQEQIAAPPIENVHAPITHVERKAVDAVVAAGVPRFIQGFEPVEQLDEDGRFVGWKIVRIHDKERFDGLGIGRGDVITSVNGLPIERPAHVYEVMIGLKKAKSIDVEYLRGGRVMRLSLPILGESDADAAPAPQKKPAKAEQEKKAEAPSESEKKKPAEAEK